MDLVEAQDRYAASLKGVTLVLMLASMLHGIGVGNMLPSAVRVVCIDINPAWSPSSAIGDPHRLWAS
jgi:Uncharacterized conserved protein